MIGPWFCRVADPCVITLKTNKPEAKRLFY